MVSCVTIKSSSSNFFKKEILEKNIYPSPPARLKKLLEKIFKKIT